VTVERRVRTSEVACPIGRAVCHVADAGASELLWCRTEKHALVDDMTARATKHGSPLFWRLTVIGLDRPCLPSLPRNDSESSNLAWLPLKSLTLLAGTSDKVSRPTGDWFTSRRDPSKEHVITGDDQTLAGVAGDGCVGGDHVDGDGVDTGRVNDSHRVGGVDDQDVNNSCVADVPNPGITFQARGEDERKEDENQRKKSRHCEPH